MGNENALAYAEQQKKVTAEDILQRALFIARLCIAEQAPSSTAMPVCCPLCCEQASNKIHSLYFPGAGMTLPQRI
jgi:hypothetical protein